MRAWKVLVTAMVVLGVVGVDPAIAARKPDVALNAISSPAGMRALGATQVVVKVSNVGKATASAPTIVILLSSDRRRSGNDRVVGSAAPKSLRAGRKAVVRVTTIVPSNLRLRSYYLIACASTKKQSQASTRNDCSATRRRIAVKAAASAIIPQISTVDAAAVHKTIDQAGGSVDVALPDGTHATLAVPAKALATPTAVALVPVASVTPGPAGIKPAATVLIQPEGVIAEGSTLTFSPAAAIAHARLRSFAFGGEDESIVAAPFLPRSGVALDASVFGGYGIGTAVGPAVGARARAAAACRVAATGVHARASAVDPCKAESLRKRQDEIAANVNLGDQASRESAFEAADAFVEKEVDPAIEQEINEGAIAEEVGPLIAIELGVERQEQLLGISQESKNLKKLPELAKRVAENSIKRCESRSQGPITTAVQLLGLERQSQLLGSSLGEGVDGAYQARCASKPWHLLYDMTVREASTTSPAPPSLTSANGHVADLEVPVPSVLAALLGQPAQAGQKALAYSGLGCSPGAAFISCAVTAASGDLKVQPIDSITSSKGETRCNRTVQVAFVQIEFEFSMVSESQTLHLILLPEVPPVDAPSASIFDRALSVTTVGEAHKLLLPDNGGSMGLVGSSPDFHGSGLSVNDNGLVLLSLK